MRIYRFSATLASLNLKQILQIRHEDAVGSTKLLDELGAKLSKFIMMFISHLGMGCLAQSFLNQFT